MNRLVLIIGLFCLACYESPIDEFSKETFPLLEEETTETGTQSEVSENNSQTDDSAAVAENASPLYLANNGLSIKASTLAKPGDQFLFQGITYAVVDNTSLRAIVANEREDLSRLITTYVTDMSFLFQGKTTITPNIASWDTSNVSNMDSMFQGASVYNGDIRGWDTSKASNMSSMFENALAFNQNLSNWCVSLFTVPPANFALNSSISQASMPLWGTCPP